MTRYTVAEEIAEKPIPEQRSHVLKTGTPRSFVALRSTTSPMPPQRQRALIVPLTAFKVRRVGLTCSTQKKVLPQRAQEHIFRPGLLQYAPVQRDESGLLVLHPVAPDGTTCRKIGISDI